MKWSWADWMSMCFIKLFFFIFLYFNFFFSSDDQETIIKWMKNEYYEIACNISKWINMRTETEIWVCDKESQDYFQDTYKSFFDM